MTTTLKPTTDIVQNLIRSCRHTHEGFRCAAETVSNQEVKRLFSIYAQQRTRFAEELCQHLPAEAGANPSRVPSEVAWDGMGANEILRECLNAEKRSLDLYSEALATRVMPTKAHFLVSAQFSLLQRVHDRVTGILASTQEPSQKASSL